MEMKPGYKQTEVGVIPEDWALDHIENVAHITTGGRNTQDRVEDGEYPFFVRSQTVERINSYSFDGEAVLTAGDGVGTGKVFHYITGKFDVHQRVYRISNFAENLNGFYFYLYFSTHFYNRIMQMTAKSSVDSVRREMIARMLVPLPPTVDEQRAIAEALSDVDGLLGGLDRLIAKKRDLKQAAMQQLLTGQTRLPGFHGEWETKRLGNIADVLKGGGLSKAALSDSGAKPCILYGELFTTYARVISSVVSRTDSQDGVPSISGDVLMPGSTTTTGIDLATASALLLDNVALGGDINIIRRKKDEYSAIFLAYFLTHSKRQAIAELSQGITIHHLYGRDLKTLQLRLPKFAEQAAIAEVLTAMDGELAALDQRREKTRALKQAMMQELLTGRIRLV
jgi:type I restriction enzyme S subunit